MMSDAYMRYLAMLYGGEQGQGRGGLGSLSSGIGSRYPIGGGVGMGGLGGMGGMMSGGQGGSPVSGGMPSYASILGATEMLGGSSGGEQTGMTGWRGILGGLGGLGGGMGGGTGGRNG